MKFIRTTEQNRYINADAILELNIEQAGIIAGEDNSNCYRIMAVVQGQQYPLVVGTYNSKHEAEIELIKLVRTLSSVKAYEMGRNRK